MADYEDEQECSPEELAQYEEAMRLNAQLKAMMDAGEVPAGMMDDVEEDNDENYYEPAPRMRKQGQGRSRPHISKGPEGMSRRTQAPAGSHLKQVRKSNYTHDDRTIRETTLENRKLFEKLNSIARGKNSHAVVKRAPAQNKKKSSNFINRKKQENATMEANQKMLRRLQGAKSSYSSATLKKDYKKNKQIANRIRTVKPRRPRPQPEWQD
jgi:hypothetical protein